MASRCDIEISIDLQDDIIVAATCGCDIDILIEVDKTIEIEAFDWPPVVDLLKTDIKSVENRVKELEDNPSIPTIKVDDEVTEQGTNPVSGRGIWAALSSLAEWFSGLFSSHVEAETSAHPRSAIVGLTQSDAPAFEDISISALSNPASYDAATLAYLTELFGGLSDSVKENILRSWETLATLSVDLKINALGSISGGTEIDLDDGNYITATLTGGITLSFTGLPSEGKRKQFILRFTNIQEIIYPVGTKFTGGIAPTVISSPCEIYCDIDHLGNLEVKGIIDDINLPI